VGVAFGLVIGAGAATAIGASVVFFPSLVKLASRRFLAGALGFSAGVMTYVSYMEIFPKSVTSFENGGFTKLLAYVYATLSFFGGVMFMLLIDVVVKIIPGKYSNDHFETGKTDQELEEESCTSEKVMEPSCVCSSDDPVAKLNELQIMGERLQPNYDEQNNTAASVSYGSEEDMEIIDSNTIRENPPEENEGDMEEGVEQGAPNNRDAEDKSRLLHMGIKTALAIGLHNFPEGLATFVAALDNPRVGGVLAVAIGIHNIPEGLCIALPIYYATGNRRKAFLWAMVSGLSEPLAALLGWVILASVFTDSVFAVFFGLVGGMMVIVSAKELLPTAHRYDPDDTVVTFSFIGGMVVMAVSLVLFQL
jgi:ZIP family zinc transporter